MDYEEIMKRNTDYESDEQIYNRLHKRYQELEEKKVDLEKEIENIERRREENNEDIEEISSYLSTGKKIGIVRGVMLDDNTMKKRLLKSLTDLEKDKKIREKTEKEIEEVSELIDKIKEVSILNITELEKIKETYIEPINAKERYNKENKQKAEKLNETIERINIELDKLVYYINEGVYSKEDLKRKKELEKEKNRIQTELNELSHGMGTAPELRKLNEANSLIERYNEMIEKCNSINKKDEPKTIQEDHLMTPEEIFNDFEETNKSDDEILRFLEPEKLVFEEEPTENIVKVDISQNKELSDKLLKEIEQYVILTGNAKEKDLEKAFKINEDEASLALNLLEEKKVVSPKENGIRKVIKSADEFLNENYEEPKKAGFEEENSDFDEIFKEESKEEKVDLGTLANDYFKEQKEKGNYETQSLNDKINEFNKQISNVKELIIEYIKDKETVSEIDLKMKFNIPNATMVQILKDLEKEGLIEKKINGEITIKNLEKITEPIEAEVITSEIIDETLDIKEPTKEENSSENIENLTKEEVMNLINEKAKKVAKRNYRKASYMTYGECKTKDGKLYFLVDSKDKNNIEDLLSGEVEYLIVDDDPEKIRDFINDNSKKTRKISRKIKRKSTVEKQNKLKEKAKEFLIKASLKLGFLEPIEQEIEKPLVCPNCRVQNLGDAIICENCGKLLKNIEEEKSNGRTR